MNRRTWFGSVVAGVFALFAPAVARASKYQGHQEFRGRTFSDQAEIDAITAGASSLWFQDCVFKNVIVDLSRFGPRQYGFVNCRTHGSAFRHGDSYFGYLSPFTFGGDDS